MFTVNNEILEWPEMQTELLMPVGDDHRSYLNKKYGSNYIQNGKLLSRPLNWSTFDAMYNEGKKLGIPYNTLIGIMANVAVESGGYEEQRQINWNHKQGTPWTYLNKGGTGLIQFTGQAVPKNQRQYLYDSVLKPFHSQTNYWKGRDQYRSGLQRGAYNLRDSILHYRLNFVRPGKPAMDKAYDIGDRLSKIYKKYSEGNKININGVQIGFSGE